MYKLVGALEPEPFEALARATFAEMALAGVTLVGEFHYVHHGPGGVLYDEPNLLGKAVLRAAAAAGIRATLLDACYLHGGIGSPPGAAQQRFSDGDAERWADRVAALRPRVHARIGAAIHSVRAVDPDSARKVAQVAADRSWPLHAHASEQPAENEECARVYGASPIEVLEDAGALSPRFTVVHATHASSTDAARLGGAGASVCLCPTTERDLADGIGPARRLADAGVSLALGSDSHAIIDLFEEARAVELDERLHSGVRGLHGVSELLRAATRGGYESLGWPEGGRIEPGALADLVTVALGSPRLAGTQPGDALASVVFAASAADISDVIVGGRELVRDGRHVDLDVTAELQAAIAAVAL
jgi:formiminoglutamate deiminase